MNQIFLVRNQNSGKINKLKKEHEESNMVQFVDLHPHTKAPGATSCTIDDNMIF